MYAVHAPVQATMLFGHVQVGGEIDKETFVQLMLKMSEFTVKKSLGITDLVRSSKHIFVPRCHGNPNTHCVAMCFRAPCASAQNPRCTLDSLLYMLSLGASAASPCRLHSLLHHTCPLSFSLFLSLSFAIPRFCSALAHCRFVRC